MPEHLYRRSGSRVWQIRYRGIRRSLQTADLRLARERLTAEKERIDRELWGDERHCWSEVVLAWHAQACGALAPSTVSRYLDSLRMVAPLLEPLHVDEIDRRVLARIAGRAGVTNATRRRDLSAVAAVLRCAEGQGWLARSPSRDYDTRLIPERRSPIVLPTDSEVRRLASSLSPMLGRAVLLLRYTGLRLDELRRLRWPQVDLQRRTIEVIGKGGKRRVLDLSSMAVATLQGLTRHVGCQHVLWHSQRAPRAYSRLKEALQAARDRLGLEWRTHDLRHLYAVEYLQAGGGIYRLQQQLGHSSVQTTEIYLSFLSPEEAERARVG